MFHDVGKLGTEIWQELHMIMNRAKKLFRQGACAQKFAWTKKSDKDLKTAV